MTRSTRVALVRWTARALLLLVVLAPVVYAITACDPPPSMGEVTVQASTPLDAVQRAGWTVLAPAGSGCWSAWHRRGGDREAVPVYATVCATCGGGACVVH